MSSGELGRLIEESTAARSMEEIHDLCSAICDLYGFDHFFYAASFPRSLVKPLNLVISGFPDGWRDHYQSRGYLRYDPAVRHCARSARPAVWADLLGSDAVERRGRQVMREAADHGLVSGLSVPIRDPHGVLGLLSLSTERSMAVARRDIQHSQPFLMLLSVHVHEAACRLVNWGGNAARSPRLTAREQECLLWSAEGKTSWEIAQILGISERTVVFHLQNVMQKLDVSSRQQAVARAISQGLIEPQLG